MPLGGGTFTTTNKVLPGTYHNVVSQPTAVSGLGERGIVARPIALKWGAENAVLIVTAKDFQENSLNILGYKSDAPEMLPFREIFKNAYKVIVYNLSSGGKTATSTYGSAKHPGALGNSMQVIVQANVDKEQLYDVTVVRTDMGNREVFTQTVASAAELKDNAFIVWNKDAELTVTAGTPLTGGADGTVSTEAHQSALDKLESYTFNMLVGVSTDTTEAKTLNALYKEYTIRRRETTSAKFQTIVASDDDDFDHEGIVRLPAKQGIALDWAAGALAGAAGNTSCTNKTYDGELTIDVDYTQTELEQFIKNGVFVFHNVDDEVHVLTDINTFVSYTPDKGEDYSSNQVIRTIDMRSLGITKLHNKKYIGKIQNNDAGRASLWADIVALADEQVADGSIDKYDSSSLVIAPGAKPKQNVVKERIKPVVAMEQLYMTTVLDNN